MAILDHFAHIWLFSNYFFLQKYGHYGYLIKGQENSRTAVKTVYKNMPSITSYSQNDFFGEKQALFAQFPLYICPISKNGGHSPKMVGLS